MTPEMTAWLKTRPESVQKLAAEFPIGCVLQPGADPLYLVGYNEDDMLIVSYIDPVEDWDGAMADHFYVCADHFRGAVILSRDLRDPPGH